MTDNLNRAGRFFLKQRGKRGTWQNCWFENGQKHRLSCGTADVEAARQKLCKHALTHTKPQVRSDDQLAVVLARYWTEYAQHLPSARSIKAAVKNALQHWKDDPNVSALDRKAQLSFVTARRAEGLSDWTIQNRLGRIWAAMNWAKRDNPALVVPDMITAADWKPVLQNRERVYSLEELAALFNATTAESHFSRAHWRRFLILAVASAGREAAIRELTWAQIDTRLGRIALNPEGRQQTKKRRAVVPICPTLAAELASWKRDGDAVVSLRGKPLATSEFFDNLAEAAGVDGRAHVIRHTVRTWLAEHGVPDSDADMFMGHKGSGSHTGARYIHRKPEYLVSVTKALEELFAALNPLLDVPLAGSTPLEDQPLPGPEEAIVRSQPHS